MGRLSMTSLFDVERVKTIVNAQKEADQIFAQESKEIALLNALVQAFESKDEKSFVQVMKQYPKGSWCTTILDRLKKHTVKREIDLSGL